MRRCQGAQNTGRSIHKFKCALKCSVWSQCTPVTGRKTYEHHGKYIAWRFVQKSFTSSARNIILCQIKWKYAKASCRLHGYTSGVKARRDEWIELLRLTRVGRHHQLMSLMTTDMMIVMMCGGCRRARPVVVCPHTGHVDCPLPQRNYEISLQSASKLPAHWAAMMQRHCVHHSVQQCMVAAVESWTYWTRPPHWHQASTQHSFHQSPSTASVPAVSCRSIVMVRNSNFDSVTSRYFYTVTTITNKSSSQNDRWKVFE